MRAGLLRHRVKFQRPVETQDSYGEPDVTWYTIGTYWARVENVNGMEVFADDALRSKRTVRFTCRYSSDLDELTPKHRLWFNNTAYDIQQVLDAEAMNRELHILATVRDG